jgi:hypothetical protein
MVKKIAVKNLIKKVLLVSDTEKIYPLNRREKNYGIEYGFSLYSACHYYSHIELPEKEAILAKISKKLIKAPLNTSLENGIHELEGLSYCLQKGIISGKHFVDYLVKYTNIFLSDADLSGQLFPKSISSWNRCEDHDQVCKLVVNAGKQAHIIDLIMHREDFQKICL